MLAHRKLFILHQRNQIALSGLRIKGRDGDHRDMSLQKIRRVVRHRVEKRRGVHASAPVFAGTRIRVATVQRYLQQGYETSAILEAFPDLGWRTSTRPGSHSPPRASAFSP